VRQQGEQSRAGNLNVVLSLEGWTRTHQKRLICSPTGSASLSSASPLSSIGRDRSSSSSDENSSEESSDPEESGGGSGSGSGTESPQHSHRSSSSMLSSSEEASDELSSDEESHFRLLLKSSAGQRALTEEVKDIAQRVDRQAERERRRAWRRRMTREPRASFALVMRDEEAQVYVGSDEDSSSESSEIVLAFDESIDDEVLGDDAFVKRVDRALALARAGPTAAVWVVQKLVCLLGSLIRRSFSAR
jgi:hypothetical protein